MINISSYGNKSCSLLTCLIATFIYIQYINVYKHVLPCSSSRSSWLLRVIHIWNDNGSVPFYVTRTWFYIWVALRASHKKQEPLSLREHMASSVILVGFIFHVAPAFLFCLPLVCVPHVASVSGLSIPNCFSLTFNYMSCIVLSWSLWTNNKLINQPINQSNSQSIKVFLICHDFERQRCKSPVY